MEHSLCLQNLSLSEILVDVEKRGSSFGELLAVPEQDNWVYVDGKSTSCIAFVFEMYKEAGLFGSLSSAIQVTEFTVSMPELMKYFTFMLPLFPLRWLCLKLLF